MMEETDAKATDSATNVDTENKEPSAPQAESFENLSKDDLLAQMARLQSKAERLENESRKYKKNWQSTKQTLEEQEHARLQEQGKFKELYEAERKRNEEMLGQFVKTKVQTAVEREAAKAGCVSVDALLKLGNSDYLQVDDSGDVVGVETFLEDAKKRNPFLFQAQTRPSINPMSPNGGFSTPKSITAKDYGKLDKQSQKAVLAKLLSKKG